VVLKTPLKYGGSADCPKYTVAGCLGLITSAFALPIPGPAPVELQLAPPSVLLNSTPDHPFTQPTYNVVGVCGSIASSVIPPAGSGVSAVQFAPPSILLKMVWSGVELA
jgi:hypothetical protein